jgi:hypothetical protein
MCLNEAVAQAADLLNTWATYFIYRHERGRNARRSKEFGMKGLKSIIPFLALVLQMPFEVSGWAFQSNGEITLAQGTRISLHLNDYLSTKSNNEGDSFTAIVAAPVYLGDRLIIPKGSLVTGSISRILRPGRFKGKAIMNLLFQSIQIPGRPSLQIVASLTSVDAEGNASVRSEGTIEEKGSAGKDATRILKPGLTGAGIGAIAGGGKGGAIGAGLGAAVGLATVFATRGKDLEVHRGAALDISLDRPLAIPTEFEVPNAKSR